LAAPFLTQGVALGYVLLAFQAVYRVLPTHFGKWKCSLAPEGLDRGSQPFQRLVSAVGGNRRAFRYATSSRQSRVPKGTLFPSIVYFPAIEMAGYHCLMPMASFLSIVYYPAIEMAGYHCLMPMASFFSIVYFQPLKWLATMV